MAVPSGPGMVPAMSRTLLLLSLLACGGDAPTDTDGADPDGRTLPYVGLLGEWWLPEGELLPTQAEDWCSSLTPDRVDLSDACFRDPTSCEQGILFEDPPGPATATRLLFIRASDCTVGDPVRVRAQSDYGSFEWEGPTEDGTRDVWRVNARRWIVEDIDDSFDIQVESGDHTFRLTEDYRWDEE